jgi:hypothetical protein
MITYPTNLNLLERRLIASQCYTPAQVAETMRRWARIAEAEEQLLARLQAGERVVI